MNIHNTFITRLPCFIRTPEILCIQLRIVNSKTNNKLQFLIRLFIKFFNSEYYALHTRSKSQVPVSQSLV